jgi:hypothetical protein
MERMSLQVIRVAGVLPCPALQRWETSPGTTRLEWNGEDSYMRVRSRAPEIVEGEQTREIRRYVMGQV